MVELLSAQHPGSRNRSSRKGPGHGITGMTSSDPVLPTMSSPTVLPPPNGLLRF